MPERLKGGDVSGKKLSVDKKTVEAFQLSSEKIGALEKLLDVDPDTNKKKKWYFLLAKKYKKFGILVVSFSSRILNFDQILY